MLKVNKLAIFLLTLFLTFPLLEVFSKQRTCFSLSRFAIGKSHSIAYQYNNNMTYTGVGIRSEDGLSNLNSASLASTFYLGATLTNSWHNHSANSISGKNSNMVFNYITLGFSVLPKFSSIVEFKPIASARYQHETIITPQSVIYNFGTQYEHKLTETKSFTIRATFRPQIKLKSDTTIYTKGREFGKKNTLFQEKSFIDTIKYVQNIFSGNKYKYASSCDMELSYKDKVNLAFDYLAKLRTSYNYVNNIIELQNSSIYTVEAEFIQNERDENNYLTIGRYRVGTYYQNENFQLDNNDIYNYGIAFGIGLSLKGSTTAINYSHGIWQKRSKQNNNMAK